MAINRNMGNYKNVSVTDKLGDTNAKIVLSRAWKLFAFHCIGQLGAIKFDGAVKQTVVAGAEYKHTETARPRDSLTVDNLTGAVSKIYAGSTYPNKTFPDSKRKTLSLYAQDSLTFGNGIVLTPALRYEKDRLITETDRAYLNANPDGTATRFNDSALTPSLRLSVPMGEQFHRFRHLFTRLPHAAV